MLISAARITLMFAGELLFWASILGLAARNSPAHFDANALTTLDKTYLWIMLLVGLVVYGAGKRSLRAHRIHLADFLFRFVLIPIIILYYARIPLILLRIFAPDIAGLAGIILAPIGESEALVLLIVTAAAGTAGELAGFYGAFSMMEDAEEVLAKDTRPPILYLRSFQLELQRATPIGRWLDLRTLKHSRKYPNEGVRNQIVMSLIFGRFGPYIALERPNMKAMRVSLGAATKSVSDDEWQGVASSWMAQAAAVIFEVDSTEGLLWEISEAIKLVEPTRILIITPAARNDYAAFAWHASRQFPKGLPEAPPEAGLIRFGPDWEPLSLPKKDNLEETLGPFLHQLANPL